MDLDVVPDSDGEDLMDYEVNRGTRPIVVSPGPGPVPPTDSISSFPAVTAKPVEPTKDSISSASSVLPPVRPRPKPAYKGAPGARSTALVESSVIESFSDVSSSLSDRVKLRTREAKAFAPGSTSSSLRNTTGCEIIDISSSEDELGAYTVPKVKLTLRGPSRNFKLSTAPEVHPSASNSPIIPFPYAHSSLPPSDPLTHSTGTPEYQKGHQGESEDLAPPITALHVPQSSPAGPVSEFLLDVATKPAKKSRQKKKVADDGEQPPKKRRAKKAKNLEAGEDNNKPKKKGKGKEKEIFTSAEFIFDDDDEPSPPTHGAPLPPLPSLIDVVLPDQGPSTLKPVSLVSIPDSQAEEELPPISGEKRRRAEKEDDESSYGGEKSPGKAAGSKKAKKRKIASSTAKKGLPKKAKGRTVISDDDEDANDHEGDDMLLDSTKPNALAVQTVVLTPVVVRSGKAKAKERTVVSESGENDEEVSKNKPDENSQPLNSSHSHHENNISNNNAIASSKIPSITSQYTIAPRTKTTPMAELIKKVNSRPGSPFPVVVSRRGPSLGGPAADPGTPTTSYSPYAKFSRRALSKIAPLHPNRRTPPPALPRAPPKPKTKKEKEREERWEEEMIDAVGGWEEWQRLSDEEQKAARRAKWTREMEGWED